MIRVHTKANVANANYSHRALLWVVQEVCPVGIRLHVPVDEELVEEEPEDGEGDGVAVGLVKLGGALVNCQA